MYLPLFASGVAVPGRSGHYSRTSLRRARKNWSLSATAVRTTGYSIKASRSNVHTRRSMMRLDSSATQTANRFWPPPLHRPAASRRMHACRRTQLASLIDFAISAGRASAPVYGNFRALVSIWIARITLGANVDGESILLVRAIGILALSRPNYFRSGGGRACGRAARGWGWALEFIGCRGALSVSLPFIWKQLRYKLRPFLPKWTRCALNSVHISRTSFSEFHIFVKSLD